MNTTPKVHVINDQLSFEITRMSKWTWQAQQIGGDLKDTAPSVPKLKMKLNEKYGSFTLSDKPKFPVPDLNRSRDIRPTRLTREQRKAKREKTKQKNPKKTNSINPLSMRQITLDAINSGLDDNQVLDLVLSQKSKTDAKYDMTHVKWYRSHFAKHEMIEPKHAPKGSKKYKMRKLENNKDNSGSE